MPESSVEQIGNIEETKTEKPFYLKVSCRSSHALTKKRKVMTKKNVTICVSELMIWQRQTSHQLAAEYDCTTALTLLILGS